MNDIYTAKQMVSMLPDAYVKNIYSNNYKLFEVFACEFQKIYQTQLKVRQFRSVDEATGKTLDLIGENYNVSRGTMNDELYRPMVKAAIARMWCDGTFNSVLELLALTLNTDVKNVSLAEDYERAGGSSAMVTIANTPMDALNAVGMTANEYGQIVQNILPIGVGLTLTAFEGTFSYATNNYTSGTYTPELSETEGFANDAQTTGGTLSGVITKE